MFMKNQSIRCKEFDQGFKLYYLIFKTQNVKHFSKLEKKLKSSDKAMLETPRSLAIYCKPDALWSSTKVLD